MTQAQIVNTFVDPVLFQEHILRRKLWTEQQHICRSILQQKPTAIAGCHASGKCVEESEWFTLADGSRVQARDLVGKVFDIPTLALDGSVIAVEAAADWNLREEVFALETESGRRIVRNAHHPLWTATGEFPSGNRCKIKPKGWTPLSAIKPGDLIAVAEALPVFGRQVMDGSKLKLLAYLIGDGGYTTNCVSFTQQNNPQRAEFMRCADAIGCDVKQGSREIEFRVVGRGQGKAHGRNPALNFLRELGILRTHSRNKRIPRIVFELAREQIAIFLSRLYSTDGWACVGKHGVPEIGYASASQGLVRDVQDLLLKFGIGARIEPKPHTRSWSLTIAAFGDVLTFCAALGIYGKELAVERCRANAVRQSQGKQRRVWRWKKALPGTRWERVQTITPVGKSQTVAIQVPFHHTFLTSFFEHNTFDLAGCGLHWITHQRHAKLITIAPTLRQVKLMWEEIAIAARGSKVAYPEPTTTSLRISEDRYGIGFSASKGVNAQGFHGENVLIIVDEAPGVQADVFDAIQGIRLGGNVKLVMSGNPVVPSGEFYDAFARNRALYNLHQISAFDTPNLAGVTIEDLLTGSEDFLDTVLVKGLITRRGVLDRYKAWGPDHPKYKSRVLAKFPEQSPNAVFHLQWIEDAKREPTDEMLERMQGGRLQIGVDVAGPGDDETAVVVRCGGIVLARKAWPDADPRGVVVKFIGDWVRDPRFSGHDVMVDIVGIGYNFGLHLADQGFNVYGFNAGHRPIDTEQFENAKAEAYFTTRDWYRSGQVRTMAEALDEETEAQMCTVLYEETSRGRTMIESKEDARKRGVKSPDRAEAEVLAFAKVQPRVFEQDDDREERRRISRY